MDKYSIQHVISWRKETSRYYLKWRINITFSWLKRADNVLWKYR